MFLARRRDWQALIIVSYGFTVLTFLSWAAVFYAPSKYVTTELFLTLFCAMFLYALRITYRSANASAKLHRAVLWTAPFGYHVLSLANLFDHSPAGSGVSRRPGADRRHRRISHEFVDPSGLLVRRGCPVARRAVLTHGRPAWLTGGLAAWAGVYVLNLAGSVEATIRDEATPFGPADIALVHLNGLAAYLGAHVLIEPVRSAGMCSSRGGFFEPSIWVSAMSPEEAPPRGGPPLRRARRRHS